jgi:Tol biopolymer transport system component
MTTGMNIAAVTPDFSPDGKFIVFGAEHRHKSENTGKTEVAYDIYILDLDTGKPRQMTTDGKSFDPVWKGR